MWTRAAGVRGGAAALTVAGALLLAACGGGASGSMAGPPRGSAAPVATDSITITNFMYVPMAVVVAPGATVTVTNKDSVTHTLTGTSGRFDTGDIGPGRSRTFTAPGKAGTYGYICNIHQYMRGTITVRSTSGRINP
jgi:plastocyanin